MNVALFSFIHSLLLFSYVKALGTSQIRVWDSVVPSPTCEKIHQHASKLGLSHRILHRGARHDCERTYNILEETIDSILSELGDDSETVEYWCRQEWKSIEAHADVDERLAIEEQNYRFPRNGHVLYLKVGSKVRGPTCLFPECSFGGDLSSKTQESGKVELVTVPAVEGRLLRFQGDLLHAVPRPADQWLLPFTQLGKTDPESEWGRSVVLFNTWPDAPPRAVELCDDARLSSDDRTCELIHFKDSWEEKCITKVDKKPNTSSEIVDKCKIWLLGDEPRRRHPSRTVNLVADKELKATLEKGSDPSLSILLQ